MENKINKEFKVDDMSDIEAVLKIPLGKFDDFYVHATKTNIEKVEEVVFELVDILDHFDPNSLISHNHNNYGKPMEIDTLPGMDYDEDTKTKHMIEILYEVNSELRRLYEKVEIHKPALASYQEKDGRWVNMTCPNCSLSINATNFCHHCGQELLW